MPSRQLLGLTRAVDPDNILAGTRLSMSFLNPLFNSDY